MIYVTNHTDHPLIFYFRNYCNIAETIVIVLVVNCDGLLDMVHVKFSLYYFTRVVQENKSFVHLSFYSLSRPHTHDGSFVSVCLTLAAHQYWQLPSPWVASMFCAAPVRQTHSSYL